MQGVENAGVVKRGTRLQGWKTREWKTRQETAGVENAGVTSMESQNSRRCFAADVIKNLAQWYLFVGSALSAFLNISRR